MICKHESKNLNSSAFINNSIKHQTFVYKCLLNDQTVLFQTIQFSISQS